MSSKDRRTQDKETNTEKEETYEGDTQAEEKNVAGALQEYVVDCTVRLE